MGIAQPFIASPPLNLARSATKRARKRCYRRATHGQSQASSDGDREGQVLKQKMTRFEGMEEERAKQRGHINLLWPLELAALHPQRFHGH